MSHQHSSFFRRILSFRILLLVNVGMIVFLCLSLGREFVRQLDIKQNVAALQEEVEALSQRHTELQDLYTSIQTISYVEREARLKLGLQKPGEQVVIVQDPVALQESREEEGVEETMAQIASGEVSHVSYSNPKKWWFYFFDPYRFDTLRQSL